MPREKVVGLGLMAAGVVVVLLYGWLVFLSPWPMFIL
ncbi:hypothetical protein Pogu_2045 [Pyrobaculum oguniense TE7]|uniref:Uncharacterized protein n=1 Tax=Pyrobaculum oguniense (strain DSM 13380 / JCM 10595 / TE7) TaxID=698757 RepID=H6QB75_PYROT|nr:hypothetical protein Pogu_2045 [Pyrobaculum oguniense TE7]